jgi:hypothetical protein
MTKVRDLTRQECEEKKLKPIEFVKTCTESEDWDKSVTLPKCWNNIDLICKNWRNSNLDLMRAYDEGKNNGALYLGHFNDGVVE